MGKGRIGPSSKHRATGRNAAKPIAPAGTSASTTAKPASLVKTGNLRVKGTNHYHHGAKLRQLKMRAGGKAQRDARGHIVRAAEWASSVPEEPVVRVQPDRRWFGNTRVIGQAALDKFRAEMEVQRSDPYAVLLRQNKLPLSLLQDTRKTAKMNLLQVESFADTFGSRAQRKRPKLAFDSLEELALETDKSGAVEEGAASATITDGTGDRPEASHPIFQKGQSRRIWNELFKVIDSSDVLVHVLDARDPLGTRCRAVEAYVAKEAPHKHVVFLLNKADLIPSAVCARWIKQLARERPTLAFHASVRNSYGRGALIALLRQFSRLHSDKRQISVGFVGYPNVGKSSVINTLRQKAVCPVAPIPGQTKVWQYVALMKRIYLIDCPGVVPAGADEGTETEKILRGVVRVEHVACPEEHITAILRAVKPEHLSKTYSGISIPPIFSSTRGGSSAASRTDPVTLEEQSATEDFLRRLAVQSGRLLKGGEPDMRTISIIILNDWLRGRIPFFMPPPYTHSAKSGDDAASEVDCNKGSGVVQEDLQEEEKGSCNNQHDFEEESQESDGQESNNQGSNNQGSDDQESDDQERNDQERNDQERNDQEDAPSIDQDELEPFYSSSASEDNSEQ